VRPGFGFGRLDLAGPVVLHVSPRESVEHNLKINEAAPQEDATDLAMVAVDIGHFDPDALAEQRLREVRDSMESVTSQSSKAADVAARDPYWWFLICMLEARLGNQEAARTLYGKAEQCWKENRFADFELHFLNDEAKALVKQ
jgi:hypothetical protein